MSEQVSWEPMVEVGRVNILLAELVKWFHALIPFYTLVGWAVPWEESWWVVLFLVPTMKIHWMTNDGICFLSTLEYRLRGLEFAGTSEQPGFIYRMAQFVFGKATPSTQVVESISEAGMYICCALAAYRLFLA